MPDLDDIFEDIYDEVKKQVRRKRKAHKAKRKRAHKAAQHERRAIAHTRNESPSTSDAPTKEIDWTGRLMDDRAPRPVVWPDDGPLSWLRQRLNGPMVQNPTLRTYLEQAKAYRAGVKRMARSAPNEANRGRLEQLAQRVDEWEDSLQALVRRVDSFQQNRLLQRDLANVPAAIDRIEAHLHADPPPRVAQELQRTLENRRRQWETLEGLRANMEWAEVKIESTIAMLGSIYSQAHMSQSTGQMAGYRRMLSNVEEETRALDDYVTTLAQIKLGQMELGQMELAAA